VVLNARDAADRGADIRPRTKCVEARRHGDTWRLTMEDQHDHRRYTVEARALVNAGGPWASQFITAVAGLNAPAPIRLVKGSHIVLDRLFEHDRAYTFQNSDGRVCFAIPYERDFTLVGTTDEDFEGAPGSVAITRDEEDYLLTSVGSYFDRPMTRDMIRWRYAGVRPLYDDGASRAQETTRDYVLSVDRPLGKAPLLSVIGGKITTYRRLAEQALKELAQIFPHMRGPWTASAVLPGGDLPVSAIPEWIADVSQRFPFLDVTLVSRLCRAYGSRVGTVLAGVSTYADLGRDFGEGLSEREVAYLVSAEWAETADDVLWRRSKLGLRFNPQQRAALADYLAALTRPDMAAAAAGRAS
jgi:glycerol-3-phosphate dehydrogenase